MMKSLRNLSNRLAISFCVCFVGCAPSVQDPSDICSVFDQHFSWFLAARKSQRKWNVPISTQMAFMNQESSFQSRARPPRKYYLGFIPGSRQSSAYGYGQIIDSTWNNYLKENKLSAWSRSRTSFADVTDFIGWYVNHIHNATGVKMSNPNHLYYAYHEGPIGYTKGSYKNKPFLIKAAKNVERNSNIYANQLRFCEKKLKRGHPIALLFG